VSLDKLSGRSRYAGSLPFIAPVIGTVTSAPRDLPKYPLAVLILLLISAAVFRTCRSRCMLPVMPSDDHPIIALEKQFELEDSSTSPIARLVFDLASALELPWPFNSAVAKLKEHLAGDASNRIKVMLQTFRDEILRLSSEVDQLKATLTSEESDRRDQTAKDLLLDAARKAANTRAIERIRRIGLILANGITEQSPTDADEIEEMMRIATELNDRDILHLRELVRIEGSVIEQRERVERHDAYTRWEQGYWGARVDGELDSVFSKLVSYGLVAQIPPPNNLNISADFQNRYVLLKKGLRFVNLIRQKASAAS
jgi:hypothetical protein